MEDAASSPTDSFEAQHVLGLGPMASKRPSPDQEEAAAPADMGTSVGAMKVAAEDGSFYVDDEDEAGLLDLRLLHLACDADPASGTRAPDVKLVLRLANGIERSIVEGKLLPPSASVESKHDIEPRKKRAKTTAAISTADADAEASRRIAARIQHKPLEPVDVLNARTPLFIDGKDGRTPLHRACVPAKADLPSKAKEDALAANTGGTGAELTAALLEEGAGNDVDDISDISDDDGAADDEDEDAAPVGNAGLGLTVVPRRPIARPKSASQSSKPDTAWLFESACLLLGLCPGMASVRDRRGETPLHLLARQKTDGDDALIVATARSMLQFHPTLTRVQDAWGNTPLHRRVLALLDVFHPPSRPVDACPILAARAAASLGHPFADGLASLLITLDPTALMVPNTAGLTPLHLVCKYRRFARDPSVTYDLLREMVLLCPNSVAVPDVEGEFTALHYLCETSASLPLVELVLDVEHKLDAARKLGLLLPPSQGQGALAPQDPRAAAAASAALTLQLPASPSLLMQDKRGFTPLHLACLDRAGLPVLQSLLLGAPSAACVRETWGRTPLDVLWRAHAYHVGRVRDAMNRFDGDRDFAAFRASVLGNNDCLTSAAGGVTAALTAQAASAAHPAHFWAKVVALARAMTGRADACVLPELHAIAAADCPVEIVEVALRLFPHQLRVHDASGDLPVHSAAKGRRREHCVPKDYERRWRREERRRAQEWLNGSEDEEGDEEALPPPPEGVDDAAAFSDDDLDGIQDSDIDEEEEDFSVVSGASASSLSTAGGIRSSFSLEADDSSSKPEPFAEYATSSDEESVTTNEIIGRSTASSIRAPSVASLSVIHEAGSASSGSENSFKKKKNDKAPRIPCSALDLLLDLDPESALLPDGRGRLPVHIALASGRTWSSGVRTLMSAGPAAAARRDPETGLYPFMLAAATATASSSQMQKLEGAKESKAEEKEADELRALNTTFVLLHCRPELVATGISI